MDLKIPTNSATPSIDEVLSRMGKIGTKPALFVSLMYGFQAEPTPTEENKLLRLREFRNLYPNISLGFMDHSLGTSDESFYFPLIALSLGVAYIEKHITLDPILQIEDYISALEPTKFEKFVSIIGQMEPALGKSDLDLTEKELRYKSLAGKVVVAKREISEGTTLREEDLVLKRVGTDGSPDCFRTNEEILGSVVQQSLSVNSPVTRDLI